MSSNPLSKQSLFQILLACVAFCFCWNGKAKAEAESLNFTQVADGVYVFEGALKEVFDSKTGQVSNITFIVGKESVAIIDTGASLNQGRRLRAAIRERTNLPIKYVINTHVHLDHIFGNQAFVVDKPQFIAHKNYPSELAAKGSYYLDRMQAEKFVGSKVVQANKLVENSEVIDLGERQLQIIAVKRAHTNQLVIWFL